jgi:hypothetical protein
MRSFCAGREEKSDAGHLVPSPRSAGERDRVRVISSTIGAETPNHPHLCPFPEYRERGARPELFYSGTATKIQLAQLLFGLSFGNLDSSNCPVSGN